jgi:hypothetical protein
MAEAGGSPTATEKLAAAEAGDFFTTAECDGSHGGACEDAWAGSTGINRYLEGCWAPETRSGGLPRGKG